MVKDIEKENNGKLSLIAITTLSTKDCNADNVLEWILKEFLKGSSPLPPPLMTDQYLPLMDREEVLGVVVKNSIDRYSKYLQDIRFKIQHPLVVITGAPGTGKTRLLSAIGQRLSNVPSLPPQHLSIEISFKSGSMLLKDSEKSQSFAIAIRILYRYFFEGTRSSFQDVCRSFLKAFGSPESLTPLMGFMTIHKYIVSLGKADPNSPFMINFSIDEIQQALFDEYTDAKHRGSYLSATINSLSDLLLSPPYPFFFNISLAGTILTDISAVISKDSCHSFIHVSPTLLTYESYMSISRTILGDIFPKNIHLSLIFTGGWPRVLEIVINLIQKFTRSINDYKLTKILSLVQVELEKIYPRQAGTKLHPLIISYAISGLKVSLEDYIQDGKEIATFESLQANGLLSLSGSGLVILPLIFIYIYIEKSVMNSDFLFYKYISLALNMFKDHNYDDRIFEKFCAYYLLARMHAFSILSNSLCSRRPKNETITIKDLFGHDALFTPQDLKDQTIDITNFSKSTDMVSPRRIPETGLDSKLDWKNGKMVIVNGKDSFVDILFHLSDKYYFTLIKSTDMNNEIEFHRSAPVAVILGIEPKDFINVLVTNKRETQNMEENLTKQSKEKDQKGTDTNENKAKTQVSTNLSTVLVSVERNEFFSSFAEILSARAQSN
ncbi:hypothetical protein CYY_007245 [Polysphondylium violaceum]|uniref:Uncharacterized protein n=1 Tax=Polysphondylium violaceum TaxID=133409 RepID=A0A8J4PQQ6_9MYCE|nr:hypothetical protein CYY_007245 [Polysphondylium violaceum]